jgi:hypothetical protein
MVYIVSLEVLARSESGVVTAGAPMHSVREHSQFAPTALGALMDPEFLRRAWDEGDPTRPSAPLGGSAGSTWSASLFDRCAQVWRDTLAGSRGGRQRAP